VSSASGTTAAEAAPPTSAPTPKPADAALATPAAPASTEKERGVATGAPGVGNSAATSDADTSAAPPSVEMLDVEGSVSLQVPQLKPTLRTLRQLTARMGGVITEERIDTTSGEGTAQVTLRVPSGKAYGVLDELEQLGTVLSQNVTVKDIGKEYFDAKLRLSSLEVTLHRYEEILAHASQVEELLRIEQELGRLRAEIEQVKGHLRWLSDRAARATLHLALREQPPRIATTSPEPDAKFYPGLRLPLLIDFGRHTGEAYFGGGVSVRFSRAISLDLDILERPGLDAHAPDALLATLGGELYSDRLGGGTRRFFNPYLGWRAGYARFDHDNQALLGATIGLELYKSGCFGVDVEARNYLAFIGERGTHYLLNPALSVTIAF